MVDVHYKLKPILKELENYIFQGFLSSNDFDREIIKGTYGELWNTTKNIIKSSYDVYHIYKPDSEISFETFCRILKNNYTVTLTNENSLFSNFLTFTLICFFKHRNVDNRFEKIFPDLDYLPISEFSKLSIKMMYDLSVKKNEEAIFKRKLEEEGRKNELARKKILRNENKISNDNKALSEKNKPTFEIKKKNWIKSISKAEIQKVVDEIIDFDLENDSSMLIGLSFRWQTLQNDYHKGILKRDEYEIENNRIVQALLIYIKNLKNTKRL